MSDAIIDGLKKATGKGQDTQTAQIKSVSDYQDQKKESPQSATPASDAIIDSLKTVQNPPSRAQTEKGKKLPQSGSIISDAVIDGLKATGAALGKDRNPQPQSGTPVSDKVIDTLKVMHNPPSRAQVDNKALPQSMTPMSDVIIDTFKMIRDPPSRA